VIQKLTEISWPATRIGEAIEALGRHSGLGVKMVAVDGPPAHLIAEGGDRLSVWIESTARWLGLEAEPVAASYGEVDHLVWGSGPALLRLPGQADPRFLVLQGGDRRQVALLTPQLATVRLAPAVVRTALCAEMEAPVAGAIEEVLAEAGIRGRRLGWARAAYLGEVLARKRIGDCWLIRSAGGANWRTQAREAGFLPLLGVLLVAHASAYALWVLSWWLLGWLALQGRLDPGWFLAWLLLLGTLIPFRLFTTAAGGRLSIRAGAALKRRLLVGALQMDPDKVRHLGVGQLLGRVIESEVVESLALTGGFVGLTAILELVVAGFVLGAGAGSGILVVLLLGSVLATFLLGLRSYRRRRQWTQERLDMTNDLVEHLVGHRTRVAQEPRQHWNEGEDQALERYYDSSRHLDRTAVGLQVLVPRGWFLVSLLGLAPGFVRGEYSTAALAVGIGGILLAYMAFRNLVEGSEQLVAVAIAWERIKPFWQAATFGEPVGQPRWMVAASVGAQQGSNERTAIGSLHRPFPSGKGKPLIKACNLSYRYAGRDEPVLQGVELQICAGDRLLLEGRSGGGKSTLGALLAGARVPSSGLLLLEGLDRETLGADGWRRRVVLVPQFHENHVLMGTMAFNLLMGRGWPPRPADLQEAEAVCRALDLGPLLERMPARLNQMVGETGWQLSHGEKSRLYVARALLQGADVLILDESFAALDPQTLRNTLATVLARAPTVLVIAHP
jgi:ATP-binding cassette subfamily B protein